jgi:hypothetical protein
MATLAEIPSLLRIRDGEDHNAVSGGELRAGCEMPTAYPRCFGAREVRWANFVECVAIKGQHFPAGTSVRPEDEWGPIPLTIPEPR